MALLNVPATGKHGDTEPKKREGGGGGKAKKAKTPIDVHAKTYNERRVGNEKKGI